MKYFLIIAFLLFSLLVHAQQQWIHYLPSNSGLPGFSVREILIDSTNSKWFVTDNGLARYSNNDWTVWDTNNSPLTSNDLYSIIKDKNNIIWIATRNKGIFRFDGTNWIRYYSTNLGYNLSAINKLRIDNNNMLWACSQTLGLLKFYSSLNKWIRYYPENSGLPDYSVTDVKFEGNIKWIGTVMGGIARFDDTSWTVYNTNNTPLISNFIEGVGIDNYNNKWFCTRFGGVAKFNTFQNQWTLYTSTNSGLPWDNTSTVFIDDNNVKWIGILGGGFVTYNDTIWNYLNASSSGASDFKKDKYKNMWISMSASGVYVYNPSGVVKISDFLTIIENDYLNLNAYPNPFNNEILFDITLNDKSEINLSIYDVNGKLVKKIKQGELLKGNYQYKFNSYNLSSGIYFSVLETKSTKKILKLILLK
jgi:hypothetical protein